jgi:tRNA(fMet)-specific endonuclease VapC
LSRYLLDTDIASFVMRGRHPEITARLGALPTSSIVISAVTQGELIYGLARHGYPKGLQERIRRFLARVRTLPWDDGVARIYGDLRATWSRLGLVLGPLDMMIAAHAVAADAILVTRDKAFLRVPEPLRCEDWIAQTN